MFTKTLTLAEELRPREIPPHLEPSLDDLIESVRAAMVLAKTLNIDYDLLIRQACALETLRPAPDFAVIDDFRKQLRGMFGVD